jgi:hypothetical protein
MMNELDRGGHQNAAGDEHQQAYMNELLIALRMRGVPGPRIAEALAEVDAHLSETGEEPLEAFGPAQAYADDVVAALGQRDAPAPFWRAALSWISAVYGVGGALGAWLVIDGALAVAADEPGAGGSPAVVSLAVGVAILLALGAGLVRLTRKHDDQVLDPRSGVDMSPPLPRWVVPLMLAVPVLTLLIAVVVSLVSR